MEWDDLLNDHPIPIISSVYTLTIKYNRGDYLKR